MTSRVNKVVEGVKTMVSPALVSGNQHSKGRINKENVDKEKID